MHIAFLFAVVHLVKKEMLNSANINKTNFTRGTKDEDGLSFYD